MRRGVLLVALLCWACGREDKPEVAPYRIPSWASPKRGTGYDEKTGLPKEVIDKATGIELILIVLSTHDTTAKDSTRERTGPLQEGGSHAPFYIGREQVTQEVWTRAMTWNPSHLTLGARSPVDSVSLDDVLSFLARTGFRLPGPDEWECAWRSGAIHRQQAGIVSITRVFRSALWPEYGSEATETYDSILGVGWEWCADASLLKPGGQATRLFPSKRCLNVGFRIARDP
jgi:formylglycine-generating enzyme required for sulfatase activity